MAKKQHVSTFDMKTAFDHDSYTLFLKNRTSWILPALSFYSNTEIKALINNTY